MTNHSHNTNQTKQTARLAKRIRDRREAEEKWEAIAQTEGVLKEDGSPDPGLAYRIAYNDYEPKGKDVRERLGLKKLCLTCMRGFRKIASGARPLSPWLVWWRRLGKEERDRRIKSQYEQEKR